MAAGEKACTATPGCEWIADTKWCQPTKSIYDSNDQAQIDAQTLTCGWAGEYGNFLGVSCSPNVVAPKDSKPPLDTPLCVTPAGMYSYKWGIEKLTPQPEYPAGITRHDLFQEVAAPAAGMKYKTTAELEKHEKNQPANLLYPCGCGMKNVVQGAGTVDKANALIKTWYPEGWTPAEKPQNTEYVPTRHRVQVHDGFDQPIGGGQ